MSSTTLEEELSIPSEATLIASVSTSYSLKASGSDIPIAVKTSLRASQNPRCLIVGRQANTADLRIQHGSISRRHAALYYSNGHLTLHDMGGKHGVHINDTRVQSKQSVVLKENDSVMFGNVRDNIFSVQMSHHADQTEDEPDQKKSRPEIEVASEVHMEVGAGLTGRGKREAEIAAMMASLDDTPSYETYKASDQDAAQDVVPAKPLITSAVTKYDLPVTDSLFLPSSSHGERRHVVTCIAVDPTGSRFVVGGNDMNLRFYNFAGMDTHRTDPFKTVIVEDGHVVVDACFSNTGDRILVGTGSSQPKVLDRDGHEVIQFVRGDMYVTDPVRTVGHTHSVTAVAWNPFQKDIVLTGSTDGSARLWNLNGKTQFNKLVCDKVYRAKSDRGQKVAVTCVAFHPGGREFAFGTTCGSIQIWNALRVGVRPERAVYHTHGQSKAVNSLSYNTDGSLIASRSMDDDTVKVWDARRLSRSATPIVICTGLPSDYENCNASFGPLAAVLCAGTSELEKLPNGKRQESGKLKFYSIPKGNEKVLQADPVYELNVPLGVGVVLVEWHTKLNQIFVGFSDGSTSVYYGAMGSSSKGASLTKSKAGRPVDELSRLLNSRAPAGSAGVTGEIITPNALPMFQEGQELKRKRALDRLDPIKTRKPEPPATGIKTGGGTSVVSSFQQIAAQSIFKTKNIAGKDPREELFKYSEGKNYMTKAYEGDKQPGLAETTVEEEEETMKQKKK